jgi:hypothetical protein
MRKLFTSEENYDIVFESPLAKSHKESRSFRFFPRSYTHELLDETSGGASFWVDKKPHRFVK